VYSEHPAGVVIAVWVVPGASRDEIVGEHDGALKVRVSAPAESGRANQAVIRLLAAVIPGPRVTLLAGARSRRKRMLIRGATLDAARDALAKWRSEA